MSDSYLKTIRVLADKITELELDIRNQHNELNSEINRFAGLYHTEKAKKTGARQQAEGLRSFYNNSQGNQKELDRIGTFIFSWEKGKNNE